MVDPGSFFRKEEGNLLHDQAQQRQAVNYFDDWEGQDNVVAAQAKLMSVFGPVGVLFHRRIHPAPPVLGTHYTSIEFVLSQGRKIILAQNLPDRLLTEATHAEMLQALNTAGSQVRLWPAQFEVFVDYLLENHGRR
jgi:hypothetical protein